MRIVIAHKEVSGVFLCQEGIHWYWGPREQAKEYSVEMAVDLIRSFPRWQYLLGVDQSEALVQIDPRTRSTAPP